MKKLIALTLCLAIILCFTLTSMAAVVTFDTVSVDGKTMATTFDDSAMTFETTVTGITDQATLLAFQGTSLSTSGDTNIEYIDQTTVGDTTKFNYKLKTDPNSTNGYSYTIKVGGSNLTSPLSQVVTPIAQAATGYTISGTVSNAADATAISEINAVSKTVVKLRNRANGTAITDVADVDVDPTSNQFSLTGVPVGTYVIQIERLGYLTLYMLITVDGIEDIGTVELLGGDFSLDAQTLANGIVNALDFDVFANAFGCEYGEDEGYSFQTDLSPNGLINSLDFDVFGAGYGFSIEDYQGAEDALAYLP